jgi:hypothetical protein
MMRQEGHMSCMGEKRNAYNIFVGDNIKIYLKK